MVELTSEKQKKLYDIIKKEKEISQPELLKAFENNYAKSSARSALSQILYRMKRANLIEIVRTEENEEKGGIRKNIWSIK